MSAPVRIAARGVHDALGGTVTLLAAIALVIIALATIGAPWISPFDPNAMPDFVRDQFLAPSWHHPFGTDQFGRDVLSRVLHGGRVSLGIAALAAGIAVIVGTAWGAVAGFAGGALDTWLMRIADALLSIPRVLLLLLVLGLAGTPTVSMVAVLLGVTSWPGMSRVIRTHVRELRHQDYMLAARALGTPWWRTVTLHLLPAVTPQVIVAGTLGFASVIPLEATLSFLGLGLHPPHASWGNIILEGTEQAGTHWWLVVFPVIALLVTVLAANTLGERVQDAVDPRRSRAQ